ncbi:MAG: ATP-dependent helicase [Desulfuromusa sp.]|nr:ATP-dependent helicase [Desulfuromusa sp.]
MSIQYLLEELNEAQREAATLPNRHALVLAGAGSGKTKTIIARAAYLIAAGIPAHRIKILTFTRRAASEIVERVKLAIGEQAKTLSASTFHAWCMQLIHVAPQTFGAEGFTIIDRDDQMQLYKALRGKKNRGVFPTSRELIDLYSFARNTGRSLTETVELKLDSCIDCIPEMGQVMIAYENKKEAQHYLDFDDILEIVAIQMEQMPEVAAWVGGNYDVILVDEMQDTNPLQWRLIDPLKEIVTIFAVGDDAQSIYGFRGADFANIHSFTDRVPGSITLKLEDNYRSTQEILDLSNWLLEQSPLHYNKVLRSVRDSGNKPQLISFMNEYEEAGWIAEDLKRRRGLGDEWCEHMILVRSSLNGRVIEGALLAAKIPYQYIGGFKLLESAHIKDCLSILRLVANPLDEIAAMRFFGLWPGIGDVRASKLLDLMFKEKNFDKIPELIVQKGGLPKQAGEIIKSVSELRNNVAEAFKSAANKMESLLANKYQRQDWDKRKKDFKLVAKLAEKHTSILAFIEEYLLDPIHHTQVLPSPKNDVVTLITVHSAKGTESKVCYVVNCSPGAYPSSLSIAEDTVEEERRVLYVSFTRAKDELIVTRRGPATWAKSGGNLTEEEVYFLNGVPNGLFDETVHQPNNWQPRSRPPVGSKLIRGGIRV